MTTSSPPIALLFIATLISSVNAQVNYNWPQRSWGRVIAGAIVGGLAGLFLLCILLTLMRRRRIARTNPGAQPNFFYGKPMFGGPWGRSNGTVHPPPPTQQGQFNNGAPYNNYSQGNSYNTPYNGPQSPAPPANSEYPAPDAPLPPPAYGQEANYAGKYAPPSGPPPPVNLDSNPNYAPPSSPPPAHTTGQDNSFVGGFRT